MGGLASAAADLTYLFGRLVGDLLLGWRSGEGSRPRPSTLLCEHEDTPRRPLGVGPVHVPPTGRKLRGRRHRGEHTGGA